MTPRFRLLHLPTGYYLSFYKHYVLIKTIKDNGFNDTNIVQSFKTKEKARKHLSVLEGFLQHANNLPVANDTTSYYGYYFSSECETIHSITEFEIIVYHV